MSVLSLIEFDDVTEHSFDNTKMELLNDKGQLKSQVDANEILFSNFDGNILPVVPELSKRGNKTIVFGGTNNTGQVLGGVLNFPNQDLSNASYKNIVDVVGDFSFKVKVNMSIATVVSDRDIVNMISNIDNSKIRFYLMNDGGGITRIKREIIDSAGAITSDVVLRLEDFAINPDFEISFSNDDNGNTLTYVNGVLFSTVASPAFDFTDFDFIFNDGTKAVADFDDAQLWKAIVDLAIGAISPEDTTFDLSENVMITKIPFVVDEILNFLLIPIIPANSQLKHFVCINSVAYYHDGANWVVSDTTLAKSNTVLEIFNNLSTLPLVKGISALFELGHVYKSDLGYSTPAIERLTLKYISPFKADSVTICIITGTVLNNASEPVEGATVEFDSIDKFSGGAFVGPKIIAITDAEGKFAQGVIETETDGTAVDIIVKYETGEIDDLDGSKVIAEFPYKNRIIPNLPTKKLSDLDELVA